MDCCLGSDFSPLQLGITWPGGCKKGELTYGGQEQARNLGQWLRHRYVEQLSFLPEGYRVSFVCSEHHKSLIHLEVLGNA